ncbi:hypothetical protein ABID42_002447 [Arcicella rosea]|uniref:hypothetical protein n=1 Tax=Arcicella rosea TaxID=502909 RepID=UPI00345D3D5C
MSIIKDHNYDYYLMLRKKLRISINDIEYDKVIAHDLGRIAFRQNYTQLTRETVNHFIFTIDIKQLLQLMTENKLVIVYSVDRSDYEYQIKQTLEDISSANALLLSSLPRKITFKPFRAMFFFIYFLFKLGFKKHGFNVLFFLTSKMLFYRSVHEQLDKYFSNFDFSQKKYVSFNSVYTVENLLTQFFNKKGCSTFSLSHGFFVNFKRFIPLDIINGENIVAENILVWGDSSRNDLIQNFGVPIERISVAGNPKYKYKSIHIKQEFRKCIVLLGRVIYQEENIEIINIIKDYVKQNPNIQFELKLHLSLNTDYYRNLCEGTSISVVDGKESLTEIFTNQNYDFAIVNNSTAYYEAMYYDLICFRYEKAENEDFLGLNDKFSDVESLQTKIKYFKELNTQILNSSVESLLLSTIGMGINKYKEILGS